MQYRKLIYMPENMLFGGLFCQDSCNLTIVKHQNTLYFGIFSSLCSFIVDKNIFSWLILMVSVFCLFQWHQTVYSSFASHCHVISSLAACLNKTNLIHIALIKDNF